VHEAQCTVEIRSCHPSLEDQDILVQVRFLNDADETPSQFAVKTHQTADMLHVSPVHELPDQFPLFLDATGEFVCLLLRQARCGAAIAFGAALLADDPKCVQHLNPAKTAMPIRLGVCLRHFVSVARIAIAVSGWREAEIKAILRYGNSSAGTGMILLTFQSLDRIEHLSTMDWHFLRGVNPQPHFVAPYFDHGNDNTVADDNAFVFLP
jgi:hypothetical protein